MIEWIEVADEKFLHVTTGTKLAFGNGEAWIEYTDGRRESVKITHATQEQWISDLRKKGTSTFH